MYTIDVDARRHLLWLTLEGFWTAETVQAFARDEQAAVSRLRCPPGEHLVLADLSRFTIQTQEVVAMCKTFIESATHSSRRLALVAGPGLARIQYKRVMGRAAMQMFSTASEAEAWLFDFSPAAEPELSAAAEDARPAVSKIAGRW